MTVARSLPVVLLLFAAPALFGADGAEPPEAAPLIATLLPQSTLVVLAQLQIEGEPALEIVPAATAQVLVGRIATDGTKVIGCVDNDTALRNLLTVPPDELRRKSRAEVK